MDKTLKEMKMNSVEYWDERFSTDWKDYDGNEQTKFFSKTLLSMLPEWFIHEANENKYSICDLGCAEGDALPRYQEIFKNCEIVGEDFSDKAISIAKSRYPDFLFRTSDILKPEEEPKYPVVFCSNVVEHFKATMAVLEGIVSRAEKYAVIMIPYREEEGVISEHEHVFHTKDIPLLVGNMHLVFAKSVKCNSIYYPYEQIMMVYAKDKRYSLLSDLVETVDSDAIFEQRRNSDSLLESTRQEYEGQLESTRQEYEGQLENTRQKYEGLLENARQEYEGQLENARQIYDSKVENTKKEYQTQIENNLKNYEILIEKNNNELKNKKLECDRELNNLQSELCSIKTGYEQQLVSLNNEMTEVRNAYNALVTERDSLKQGILYANACIKQKDEYMLQAQELCQHFSTGKLMKANHLLFRIKGELLKGDSEDRKEFWSWLWGKANNTNRSIGAGAKYNPWQVVSEKLKEGVASDKGTHCTTDVPSTELSAEQIRLLQEGSNVYAPITSLSLETKKSLRSTYQRFDVIILSVIDYDFRHQRPQHFATRFADNGHRVFYVNANFVRPDSVQNKTDNLYIVDFSSDKYNAIYPTDGLDTLDWMKDKFDSLIYSYAIRDAVIIVDYPNWVYGAEHLREKFGFKIITDYMDDYTGFIGTHEDFLKNNCIRLLETSDRIAASSQFLLDVASKYADKDKIAIIRNGTEVSHFYQAFRSGTPDNKRKIIGYYGAVSHWFAYEKVCYVAKTMPECDVVIVGDVTEYRNELEKYDNIKLLGEKPYKELPEFLADFDVCLIPFDTSTDLIKATNPVKFYEYLSAGKKVVATEIPELMPFRNEYVYMSNDDKEFADYVRKCLDGTDTLKNQDDCVTFSKEHDWQKRFEAMEALAYDAVPMVSIIVLTYNNLELNKMCINSILNKTAYANYELIIVDNKSTDGTVEYLHELELEQIPNVKIIFSDTNTGFAGGNNIGIKESNGDYVLLLNNDTVISRGWLTALVKHLENNPSYGMCNPVTNSIGNESMIQIYYQSEAEMDEASYIYTAAHMNEEHKDVDRLPLFSTIIRKKVIEQIGGLGEEYAIGMFEDDDYTERVLQSGHSIVIAEDAFVHHVNNASFKKLSDEEYRKVFEKNKSIFEKKWKKSWTMPKYREGVTADCNANTKVFIPEK